MSAATVFIAFRCKSCGVLKGATNHWRLLFASPKKLEVCEWDGEQALSPDAAHVCGESCTLILTERWLHSGTFEMPQANKISAKAE